MFRVIRASVCGSLCESDGNLVLLVRGRRGFGGFGFSFYDCFCVVEVVSYL